MPLKLSVPNSAWSEASVSLGGQTYDITYRYEERDPERKYWAMDIYKDGLPVITGVIIVPEVPLLTAFGLDDFRHGDLICHRMLKTGRLPERDNFGPGKEYELVYYSAAEILAAFDL